MCSCEQGTCPGNCRCGCTHTPPTEREKLLAEVREARGHLEHAKDRYTFALLRAKRGRVPTTHIAHAAGVTETAVRNYVRRYEE